MPELEGAAGASNNPGGNAADAASKSVIDPAVIGVEVRKIVGLKEGDSLADMVRGMVAHQTKSVLGEFSKTFNENLDAKLAALKPKETPKDPEQVDVLKQAVSQLTKGHEEALAKVADELAATKQQLVEKDRQVKVTDLLGKINLKKEQAPAFRTLAVKGLLPGLSAVPELAEDGSLVVKTTEGNVPYENVLDAYLKANPTWVDQHRAAGSGAGGASAPAPTSTKPLVPSRDGVSEWAGQFTDRAAYDAAVKKDRDERAVKLFG